MKYFKKIADGIDVAPLREQLAAHPELWNQHPERLSGPFAGTDDLWIRYRALSELTSPQAYLEPHFAEFYPAWYLLPALKPIVFGLMAKVEATYLGGILISRIQAGGRILPHDDRGSWHAETMNCKVYVPIVANDQCINRCGDEWMVIEEGQAVEFCNLITHSVENNGATERVTLICCFRVE